MTYEKALRELMDLLPDRSWNLEQSGWFWGANDGGRKFESRYRFFDAQSKVHMEEKSLHTLLRRIKRHFQEVKV